MANEITQEQWDDAWEYFSETFDDYKVMIDQPGVMVGPALMMVFEPLSRRYKTGERTKELYDALMEVE
jgi:hypothetical protein